MILTQKDIDEFIEEYSDFQLGYRTKPSAPDLHWEFTKAKDGAVSDAALRFMKWIDENPQVLMASGLQEYLSSKRLDRYRKLIRAGDLGEMRRPAFRVYRGEWIVPTIVETNADEQWDFYSISALESGERPAWPHDRDFGIVEFPSANQIIKNAGKFLDSPHNDPTIFTSSRLWTPKQQERQKLILQSSAVAILEALKKERIELKTVSWRSLEEIVAEILRSSGMEIYRVEETPQGGRDIIARGDLIPGVEPITLAVEIKHKALVDRPEVQQILAQNRIFPAVMIVTSGTFSSGVIKEASQPENRLRLFLKDGVALHELIRRYPLTSR